MKQLPGRSPHIILKLSGVFLAFMGGISLFMTSSILLNWFGIREIEGNYVPFIVYANLVCSILYLFAARYFFTKNKRATILLSIAFIILIVSFVGLIFYINSGNVYELKTVMAMVFRTCITLAFAAVSWFQFSASNYKPVQKVSQPN